MLTKKATKDGKVSVTFELPGEKTVDAVALCGDFNDWSPEAHPMARDIDGTYAATVELEPGSYHFKYLLDGGRWVNDWHADTYEPNGYGSDNSVVVV